MAWIQPHLISFFLRCVEILENLAKWSQGGRCTKGSVWGWGRMAKWILCLFRCRCVLERSNLQLVFSPSKIRECQWMMVAPGIWLGFSRWHLGSEFSQNIFVSSTESNLYERWPWHNLGVSHLFSESQEAEWLRGYIRDQTLDLSPGATA